MGNVTPALRNWLTATVAEPGMRQLAKAVDAAVAAVHGLLLENVVPVLRPVGFMLGELKGLARCEGGRLALKVRAVHHRLCAQRLERVVHLAAGKQREGRNQINITAQSRRIEYLSVR